jgi:hypothetical protein
LENYFKSPIISLHVPKCGGTSLQNIFYKCISQKFKILQYYPDIGVFLPQDWKEERTIIHGHFVRWKNQAVEDICPDTSKFITLIRDPYDTCVSAYNYGKMTAKEWALKINFHDFIKWWLQNPYGPLLGALPLWEKSDSVEKYVDKFLVIGVLNQFDQYVEMISKLFHIDTVELQKSNVSDKKTDLPDLRDELIKAHPRDFEFFNFVNKRARVLSILEANFKEKHDFNPLS